MHLFFLIPQVQYSCHIVLSMLSNLLKNKICDNYIVVEHEMYFLAKPMDSRTYLDDQYFIILNLST